MVACREGGQSCFSRLVECPLSTPVEHDTGSEHEPRQCSDDSDDQQNSTSRSPRHRHEKAPS